jgi:glycogen phosphorylase
VLADAIEADALYQRLEREVIPEFYARDEQGIPMALVARMRESMARLTPSFSSSRTVREYTEQGLKRVLDEGSCGAAGAGAHNPFAQLFERDHAERERHDEEPDGWRDRRSA